MLGAIVGRVSLWVQGQPFSLPSTLPLMVIAGAAGDDRGRVPYNGTFAGVRLSAAQFG